MRGLPITNMFALTAASAFAGCLAAPAAAPSHQAHSTAQQALPAPNRIGGAPLIVVLPEAVTGDWTLSWRGGACHIQLVAERGAERGDRGVLSSTSTHCLPFIADAWRLDGPFLVFARGEAEAARFRADRAPPFLGQAGALDVTLTR